MSPSGMLRKSISYLMDLHRTVENHTRKHRRSSNVVRCRVVEGTTSHHEVLRARKHGAAVAGLGADETRSLSIQVAERYSRDGSRMFGGRMQGEHTIRIAFVVHAGSWSRGGREDKGCI